MLAILCTRTTERWIRKGLKRFFKALPNIRKQNRERMLANLLSRIITALSHPGCAVLLSKYLICKLLSVEFSWNSINCQFFINQVIITQVALWMQFEEMIHSGGGYNGHTLHLLEKGYI